MYSADITHMTVLPHGLQVFVNGTETYKPTLAAYEGQNLTASTTNDTALLDLASAVGVPFGSVDLVLEKADADFEFLDQQDAAAAAPTQPSGVVTGSTP